jgi:hypothetical protein
MTDAYALLADATTSPGRRTAVLKTHDEGYTVRGWVMQSDGRQFLLIRAWLWDKYVYVVVDDRASILATATGETHPSTYQRIREELARKRIPLGEAHDEYGLLADHVDGQRRTSVLKDDVDRWSIRVKFIDTLDEDVYLQLRIWIAELGFAHLMLEGDGAIVALVTGATDADAWDRLRGEMKRRSVELA